jgi:hypothetical protein
MKIKLINDNNKSRGIMEKVKRNVGIMEIWNIG